VRPELIGTRYRVDRAIGRGGMGTVWLCRDETLDREVAVKQVGLLPGESSTDTARALREARATASLSHRNVVAVHDVVQEDGAAWLVMEYVPSRTLAQLVADGGPVEPGRVAAIGAQVADGLLAAHGVGLVHRDVKPGNVLVTESGLAKIGDFGLSRTAQDPTITATGMLSGTPGYLAPEVARGATPTSASDAWALGATLYAAVEGRPPYSGDNPLAILHQIASEDPPRPRRAGTLEPVVMGLLARKVADRWSLERARDELRRLASRAGERTHAMAPGRAAAAGAAAAGAAAGAAAAGATARSDTVRDHDPTPTAAFAASDTSAPDRPLSQPRPAGPVTGGAAKPAPKPAPTADAPSRRRRPGPIAAGVVALLVALVAVFVLVQVLGDGGSDPNDSAQAPTGERGGNGDSDKKSPDPKQDDSSAPSPDDEGAGAGGGGAAVSFVDGYFDTVPDDRDAGWAMLSPAYQAETGRDSYDGFWSSVADVDASNLSPRQGGDAVEATVTYEYQDGRTVQERQLVHLVEGEGGDLLIDGYDRL
jgi:serine/threonine protein kinase